MRIWRIKTSSYFEKRYKRLPQDIKEKAKEKEKIFRKDCFDQRLRTHRLRGKEKGAWAFWIDYHYRLKFIFLNDEEVLFLEVGTHKIYK